MSWPDKNTITQNVVDMLNVNMKLKADEKLLVVSDYPRPEDWLNYSYLILEDMLERVILARLVAEIAREQFVDTHVRFHPFSATGMSGKEPDGETASLMKGADVLLCLTEHSLSHSDARDAATKANVRIASMPTFDHIMFAPDGPMAVDYQQVSADSKKFADLLSAADQVVVQTHYGTDLSFRLSGRPGQVDDGLYGDAPELWGNLPAGEAYVIPLEGTGEGQLVILAGWYPELYEEMVLTFKNGSVVDLQGGGQIGKEFSKLLDLESNDELFRSRRNLAELGIGTNPNAHRPDNVLEGEKIKGSVHIAIGDNIHMGGKVESDLHEDFVQPQADLYLDGVPVILQGKWKV
jgi:leucyl aminopeptidase (aminopeptidase T)